MIVCSRHLISHEPRHFGNDRLGEIHGALVDVAALRADQWTNLTGWARDKGLGISLQQGLENLEDIYIFTCFCLQGCAVQIHVTYLHVACISIDLQPVRQTVHQLVWRVLFLVIRAVIGVC